MNSRLNETDRAVYRGIADMLLPAHGALKQASAAGVAGPILDRILDWRPDIAPDLLRGLAAAHGREPQQALEHLHRSDVAAFDAIRLAVLGAYYLDPDVMNAIGYTGQTSLPVSFAEAPDYAAPGLLDPVIARGPIWRPGHQSTAE